MKNKTLIIGLDAR